MKIETLLDLKKALSKVPDKLLVHFGIGAYDGGFGLVDLDWSEDESLASKHFAEAHKLSQFKSLEKYFDKIIQAAADEDFVDVVEVE